MKASIRSIGAVNGAGLVLSMGVAEARVPLPLAGRIAKSTAQTAALSQVPNGIVRSSELERENDLLIWSFDIAQPGTRTITEVQVNAADGKIASIKTESPSDQAKETRANLGKG